jgi:hypothetical protein
MSYDPIIAAIEQSRRLDREWLNVVTRLDAAERTQRRERIAALRAKEKDTKKAADRALIALTKIRPTTLVGAAALIDYVRRDLTMRAEQWHLLALANAATALLIMQERSHAQIQNEVADKPPKSGGKSAADIKHQTKASDSKSD